MLSMICDIREVIAKRRSIREFTDDTVAHEQLLKVIQAGIWAPSGLNNQPWRFATVRNPEVKNDLAELTHYSHIIQAAPVLIAVFLDTEAMYDKIKDCQSAGACIQNMLLAAEALGLGAVWLGQILKNKEKVNTLLEISGQYELMAILAVGHPAHHNQKSTRNPIHHFILKEK